MSYQLLIKPAYRTNLRTLQRRDAELVESKVDLLIENPHPDSKNKKRIVSYREPVFRIRAGRFRVLYMFSDAEGWVSLLHVDERADVYEKGELVDTSKPAFNVSSIPPDITSLESPEIEQKIGEPLQSSFPDSAQALQLDIHLDRPVTRPLLETLGVNSVWFEALDGCTTIDALIAADIPESVRADVFDIVTSPPVEVIIAQPSFVVPDIDDLIRYQRGELIEFLLKLDPEQERHVSRAINTGGPVMVKGGPGTGKSTIAIYRTLEVHRALQAWGVAEPRILFTTYTNALINSTRQLIQQLFQSEETHVTVQTADRIATEIVTTHVGRPRIATDSELYDLLYRAFDELAETGGVRIVERLELLRSRLTPKYFIDEIETIIVVRDLDEDGYRTARRFGRKVGLKKTDRKMFWRLHTLVTDYLEGLGMTTWARMRVIAAHLVEDGTVDTRYDAVFIDEAQDLQPAAIRMLAGLCASSARLMLTADTNQAIYGSSFRWVDVQSDLRFRGRTGVLHRNYRSTREIGAATASYLELAGGLSGSGTISYAAEGPVPSVRFMEWRDELAFLEVYFRQTTRDLRLGYGSCAVLVPTQRVGFAIAHALSESGLSAKFMKGTELDLRYPGIKVITHRSAKGLEFPTVALAGFTQLRPPRTDWDDEWHEWIRIERRALYVAMTRAMRTLLVLAPVSDQTALFEGFAEPLWNTGA